MSVADFVERITIESRYTPALTIDKPFESGGAPHPFLTIFQPKITLHTRFGKSVSQPWGDPGATQWPMVQLFIAAVVGIALVVVLARLKKRV
jgi:hypothetical protein